MCLGSYVWFVYKYIVFVELLSTCDMLFTKEDETGSSGGSRSPLAKKKKREERGSGGEEYAV